MRNLVNSRVMPGKKDVSSVRNQGDKCKGENAKEDYY